MSDQSVPKDIPAKSSSSLRRASSPNEQSVSRSTARLASPIPPHGSLRRGSQEQRTVDRDPSPNAVDRFGRSTMSRQPESSALASALNRPSGRSPPRSTSRGWADTANARSGSVGLRNVYGSSPGSFARSPSQSHRPSRTQSPAPHEDFEIVRKHLAGPVNETSSLDHIHSKITKDGNMEPINRDQHGASAPDGSDAPDLTDGFSSLQLQGGDMHREIYRRTEAEEASRRRRNQRSQSFYVARTDHDGQTLNAEEIRQPGGFRREHIIRTKLDQHQNHTSANGQSASEAASPGYRRNLFTSNFFEFLSLYGHFAGEDYEEDEEDDGHTDDGGSERNFPEDQSAREGDGADETRPLLQRRQSKRQKVDERSKNGSVGTALILMKSFVGTGVLFLPRAFLNGGMAFSFIVLTATAGLSYYCFLLLTTSRLKLKTSYAEMGELVYGAWMRTLINTSLVISQIGFASAYIVFTSENLRAFVLAVSHCKTDINIRLMILLQLVAFLPLSLYRNLNSLSFVVYIADLFIVLGLIYLYYYDVATIIEQGGFADIAAFNKDSWTLFIGTAIFTFEGIGLIIPIQDGMKKPQQLPGVLLAVMVIISVIFISMGALSYAAYGSKTQTVIIKNMDQSNKFVNGVQFIYSLAILLSTPMQIFPAITILEKGLFSKSGKGNRHIKWAKNVFRFAFVILCALIAWVGANDLDKFVALVGSFACIPLVYIYPPLIHRKAVDGSLFLHLLDIAFVIFGFVLMAYTTILTASSWIKGAGKDSNNIDYCR